MSPWVWIVLAVIVVAAIVGLVTSRSRTKQLDSRREEAVSLRDGAAEHKVAIRETETVAAASGAEAQRAREEAEERAAQARELEATAQRDQEAHAAARQQHDEQMRRADALDPDVRTDDQGHRLDDDGNRVGQRSGHGATSSEPVDEGRDSRDGRDEPVSGTGGTTSGPNTQAYAASDRAGETSPSSSADHDDAAGAGYASDRADERDRDSLSEARDDGRYASERTPQGGYGTAERTGAAGAGAAAGAAGAAASRDDDVQESGAEDMGRTGDDEPVRDVRTGEVLDEEGYSAERDGDGNGRDSAERTAQGGYGSAERTTASGDPAAGAPGETVHEGATGNTVEEGGNRAGNWSGWESRDADGATDDREDTRTPARSSGSGDRGDRPDDDAAYGPDEESGRRSRLDKAGDKVDDALGDGDADQHGRRG